MVDVLTPAVLVNRCSPIDIEQVKATLRQHAEHLRDELACTERAIELLGRCEMPMLFPWSDPE